MKRRFASRITTIVHNSVSRKYKNIKNSNKMAMQARASTSAAVTVNAVEVQDDDDMEQMALPVTKLEVRLFFAFVLCSIV